MPGSIFHSILSIIFSPCLRRRRIRLELPEPTFPAFRPYVYSSHLRYSFASTPHAFTISLTGLEHLTQYVKLQSGSYFRNSEGERGRMIWILVNGEKAGETFLHERFGEARACEVVRGTVKWKFEVVERGFEDGVFWV